MGGDPVDAGWIAFHPIDRTVGDHVVARLGPDGEFFCAAVPVGPLQVRLQFPESQSERWCRMPRDLRFRIDAMKGAFSKLRWNTEARGANRFDFDLTTAPGPD